MGRSDCGQDRADRLADLAQRMKDAPPIGWVSLVESYVYKQARIHVHLRVTDREKAAGFSDVPSPPDRCATYEWPWGAPGDDLEVEHEIDARRVRDVWERIYREHVVQLDGRVDQMKVAMLVDVPEFLEHREGFTLGGVLPCHKRLQRLELCSERGIDVPQLGLGGVLPRIAAVADREPNVPPGIPPGDTTGRGDVAGELVVDAQTPDQLVERRSESVDDVADDRTPEDRRRIGDGLGPDDDVALS